MPPKQKEAKKGPAFKNPIPVKDLVPADIKQPPREFKSLKYPETFPQPPKNDKKSAPIFEAWPTDQAIKAFDFGINSENRFQDINHETIKQHLKIQHLAGWKSIHEIQKLKALNGVQESQKSIEQGQNLKEKVEGQESSNQPKDPVVIQTYERDETAEETEIRMKKMAQLAEQAAKDKKKGKKQEVKEQGPVKVRDVKMSDIKVEGTMPQEALWIGSQLQTIKLRNIVDPYTREAVWKKIYPQENGVPQITKSGKYWVKLYFMGQPVKIQVDDRIPINTNSRELFPMSQKRHQKWTLIITKALIKYMALAWPKEPVTGSGLIIHALTGMISQTMEVKSENLQKLESLLSDAHYTKRDVFMSCYTNKVTIPPSNYPKANKDFIIKDVQSKSLQGQQHQFYEKEEAIYEGQQTQPINPNILPGYAYMLGDYFTNGSFNMAFSKQRSAKQAKLRLQYNNLSKVNLNNKTRDQKLQHRRKKKEIKELLAVEQKKRLDMINEQRKEYHFIKILNKGIKIRCEFDEKEILLAKKCRLNNLNQPPNYELPQPTTAEKQEAKSIKSFSVIKSTKEESEVNPNIDDFSMIQNVLDPLTRPQKGLWIKDIDFLNCFTKIQVIYKPTRFLNKNIEKVTSTANDSAFVFDETKEILVLERQEMGEDGIQVEEVELLFGFSYEESSNLNGSQPYCIMQKFDFDQFAVTSNVTKLTGKIDSTLLTLKNQNNVFKIYTMCKSNYCYWVSSDAKLKLMSISEYLEEFEGYKKKIIPIEYPAIEAKSYLPIARFGIKETSSQNNSVILKINNYNPQLTKILRYNLTKVPSETQKFIDDEVEGVIRKSCEEKHLATDYTRLNIESGQQYDLVLESCPFENIPDGSCEIVALIKNETLTFDNLELAEPLRFIDKYKPNKYGLIFRERIFSNILTKQGFLVKLVQGEQVQGGAGGGDKKAVKKGGKQETSVQFVERPLEKERTIIVRLVKNKQIIYETLGTNWTTISNVRISNLKERPSDEYFLEAYFDLRQWPEACTENQDTSKICWTISVFGTDSIAIVRDTKQEEKQRQTRKSWQDQEPGRAEKAKKSRRKFLILQKKENGEQLTQQQEQILNAPRLTKKQQQEEAQKVQDKNKKGVKKQDKKGAKEVKKQEVQEKPVQIIFPKSADNCNYEIKNFLKTLENFSVKKLEKQDTQEPRIRSDEQLRSINQSEKMVQENRSNKMLRNVERRQTIKLKERDKKDQLLLQLEELNRQFKQAWTKYIAWRNEDLEKDKTKQEKERTITEVLKQQKTTLSQADLDKILNEYQQISGFNQKLYDVGIMLKKNLKILALSDKISGHLTGWEVEELKAINEQIKNEKIQGIAENILNDMKTMLEEAEKNPAIVAEKQNDAKKAKKGGKK